MTAAIITTFSVRYLLVMLFFPFSALDKILNFSGAVGQAQTAFEGRRIAMMLVVAGVGVEILMPVGILTGVADRLAALVMAAYCAVTALLFKQFWRQGDFWGRCDGRGRELFWEFLKNFSLAGGFLIVTIGLSGQGLHALLATPLASTHPYTMP